uniref:Uncharacterized protein n=1 Tax=Ralstonia solanacearum TaxID=305 RepID=A0A0S4VFH6_RALSL|nr:protein of unknown function [Ralstonia solanacearum]CUV42675.1 protein of unknown function [Ralstonia solanacearum]CUV62461.1 protein of unknown function [Ralstonia solanacearum]
MAIGERPEIDPHRRETAGDTFTGLAKVSACIAPVRYAAKSECAIVVVALIRDAIEPL